MTLKIEKYSDGNSTTIRLIGRMQAEHLEELEKQIRESEPAITYAAIEGIEIRGDDRWQK